MNGIINAHDVDDDDDNDDGVGNDEVYTLTELAAKCVATYIPFELVEHVYPPVPEQLQLRIAFWSFPDNEEDIRLYSCLANSSSDEFNRGDQLFKSGAVKEPLQIGFHLSATVVCLTPNQNYNVAVTFDRRRISSCNCTCNSTAYWCSHVVAVCLHRIHCPLKVCLRAPVSESLTRLQRDQLQKFAQYLISELPQQILPTAQRLLDELLSEQPTAINTVCGAPDPTAGASINDQTNCDVNYLTNSAPPAATEWSSLLRPLRGREPEGMWNLLSIVREMYRRCDRNAVRLLEIITEQCMACDQLLLWWYQTKLSLMMGSHGHSGGKHSNTHSNSKAIEHASSSLFDEIVVLWRLAALNPGLAPDERDMLHAQFTSWHLKILDRVVKCRIIPSSYNNKHQQNARSDAEMFVGFKPAIEACYLDWEEYPIVGVTHTHETNPIYYSPFACFKHTESKFESNGGQLNATQALMANNKHYNYISTSSDLAVHGGFKQRLERPFRERFYISSSNNSSNSSSDSVHARLQHDLDGSSVSRSSGDAASSARTENKFSTNNINGNSANYLEIDKEAFIAAMRMRPIPNSPPPLEPPDGNRSSASSEGFCENEDFGGDSSSNNLCGSETGGCTINPAMACSEDANQSHSNLSSTNPPQSFVVCSPNSNAIDQAKQGLSFPTTPTNNPIVAVLSESSSVSTTSSSSSNSSSTSLLVAAETDSQIALATEKPISNTDVRRLSKEESFSSSSDEYVSQEIPERLVEDLTSVPSTSAASRAALMKTGVTVITSKAINDTGANFTKTNSSTPTGYFSGPSTSAQAMAAAVAIPASTASADKPFIFSNIRPSDDAWDILLARAEGLHAHGHGREACILAVRLAEEMLANPPNLMVEMPPVPKRKGKNKNVNPISHHLTVLASATLTKCAFLCTVLSENSEHYHIGFRICIYALEMPRPPASTKPLEVKLANQEADILALLKKIPINEPELEVIRDRAERLRNGALKSRGEALLPINLASYIFDALVMPSVSMKDQRIRNMSIYRPISDENLGFEAAVAALGLKANVSEAEHPLLCEGTRRQRGELALTLLYFYKDEPQKIAKIMEKLLDREIHTLLKTPLLPAYYSNNAPVRTPSNSVNRSGNNEYGRHGNNAGIGTSHNAGNLDMFPPDYGSVGGNSRPTSSTSAELEVNMVGLSVSSPGNAALLGPSSNHQGIPGGVALGTPNATISRTKDSRYKGKRAYPSIPNQPSEASAHFMFELAKNVLNKAGGNSSTSLFTQATANHNHHGPHRGLHMCAFQLGLYALGLHNCVSPNWLSRTYSSHVSWILGQAMEIGAPAISFLIDTWEGHLTPPEAANMADRTSRGWDSNYPAAELALSVLPHAAALNPNEIQRAILQCKEQSDQMLERACITVENAAKGGGVYPEVLFQVARYWYELYSRNTPNSGEHDQHDEHLDHSAAMNLSAIIESHQHHELQLQAQQASQGGGIVGSGQGIQPGSTSGGPGQPAQVGPVVVTTAPQPFQQGVPTLAPINLAPYPPYGFCQSMYHHNMPYAPNQMQMYMPPPGPPAPQPSYPGYPPSQQQTGQAPNASAAPPQAFVHQPGGYQALPQAAYQAAAMQCGPPQSSFIPAPQGPPGPTGPSPLQANLQAATAAAVYYGQAGPHQQPPPPPQHSAQQGVITVPSQHQIRQPAQQHPAVQQQSIYPFLPAPQLSLPQQQQSVPSMAGHQQISGRQRHPHQFTPAQLRYLLAAYNVGMLAMETLARRVHDDRPQAKYARNPPYGEDVKWLLRISKTLGSQYLHQFCVCAVNSIVSPFVLHDVAIESAHYLGRNNHQLVMPMRSALTPLVQKCQQMYIQCIHQKLYHLTPADYEDFASIIVAARAAFQITPEGSAQFKDWLQSIKRLDSLNLTTTPSSSSTAAGGAVVTISTSSTNTVTAASANSSSITNTNNDTSVGNNLRNANSPLSTTSTSSTASTSATTTSVASSLSSSSKPSSYSYGGQLALMDTPSTSTAAAAKSTTVSLQSPPSIVQRNVIAVSANGNAANVGSGTVVNNSIKSSSNNNANNSFLTDAYHHQQMQLQLQQQYEQHYQIQQYQMQQQQQPQQLTECFDQQLYIRNLPPPPPPQTVQVYNADHQRLHHHNNHHHSHSHSHSHHHHHHHHHHTQQQQRQMYAAPTVVLTANAPTATTNHVNAAGTAINSAQNLNLINVSNTGGNSGGTFVMNLNNYTIQNAAGTAFNLSNSPSVSSTPSSVSASSSSSSSLSAPTTCAIQTNSTVAAAAGTLAGGLSQQIPLSQQQQQQQHQQQQHQQQQRHQYPHLQQHLGHNYHQQL
uniref:SWIM-type domain-containing protein n=1 Tax=Glossina brevipalpis TaxID=37001 RepID=A0A1A9W8J2_9MUSC